MLSFSPAAPSPRRVSSTSDSTREAILDAALTLFSTKGFASSTTKEIAARAGVAEVTLFRHFVSKENLFQELLMSRSFVVELGSLLGELEELPCSEAVTILATRLFDALMTYRDWIVVMHGEIRRFPELLVPSYHRFLDALFGTLADFFRGRQLRGELRSSFDPEFAARALHGMVFCLFNVEELLGRKEYRPVDRSQAIHSFVDLLLEGMVVR
ncbi:MAG: TetR/AcrR family transcriptional regulator [Desulfuromonadia bacterium]